jgi:DNA-binding response OmpR family regulator
VDNFVARLRSHLGDDAEEPRHLETVRGIGYRFNP